MLYRVMTREYDETNLTESFNNDTCETEAGISFCIAAALDFWKEEVGGEYVYGIDIDVDTEAAEYGLTYGVDYGEILVPVDIVRQLGIERV